jgi:hypothetical protein
MTPGLKNKWRPSTLKQHWFTCKRKKNSILHGFSTPNPNFSVFTFFGIKIRKSGTVNFNLLSKR